MSSPASGPPGNDLVDLILSRRSVRSGFASRPVPTEVLEQIVRCGLAAPSSKGGRPWRFHVVTDRELLAACAEAMETSEGIDSYVPGSALTGEPTPGLPSTVIESATVLRTVPVAIFVEDTGPFSQGRDALLAASPEARAAVLIGYTFEVVGVGAAIENMWLAALSHGLVGVFIGDVLIAESAVKAGLGVTADLLGALALGYTDDATPGYRLRDGDDDGVLWHPPR